MYAVSDAVVAVAAGIECFARIRRPVRQNHLLPSPGHPPGISMAGTPAIHPFTCRLSVRGRGFSCQELVNTISDQFDVVAGPR